MRDTTFATPRNGKIIRFFCKWSNMWSDRGIDDFSTFGRAEKVSVFKGFRLFSKILRRAWWLSPERCAIPPSLHLDMVKILDFFVSGQTCGQTKNLRNFQHSGEPKKSVFSMVFGSFRKIYAENGDWDPKLARYHLRYASKIIKKWFIFLQHEHYSITKRFCQLKNVKIKSYFSRGVDMYFDGAFGACLRIDVGIAFLQAKLYRIGLSTII